VVTVLLRGLIGGCAGSTSCSIKVFRYQLLFASVSTQVRRLYAPHGIFEPRYEGRPVSEEVVSSVMAFFVLFFVALGIISVLLGLTGLDVITSVSGAAAALAISARAWARHRAGRQLREHQRHREVDPRGPCCSGVWN
jgi:trk system potassium uptake protein TrkH